jgi:hypothetical protein
MSADPMLRAMLGGADLAVRERLIRDDLGERRAVTDAEIARIREDLEILDRRERELREEVALLDEILTAIPVPPKESEAPSLFASPPRAASPAAPPRKRRRKGSRQEQMLPRLRERFGSRAFTTEDVTDLIVQAEGGERRNAYFAAWSLVRDLADDGVIAVAFEEGRGTRKKRTYRFTDGASTAAGAESG